MSVSKSLLFCWPISPPVLSVASRDIVLTGWLFPQFPFDIFFLTKGAKNKTKHEKQPPPKKPQKPKNKQPNKQKSKALPNKPKLKWANNNKKTNHTETHNKTQLLKSLVFAICLFHECTWCMYMHVHPKIGKNLNCGVCAHAHVSAGHSIPTFGLWKPNSVLFKSSMRS